MWQKNFVFGTMGKAIEGIGLIAQEVAAHEECREALLHIFVTGMDKAAIAPLLETLGQKIPQLKTVGCTEVISGDTMNDSCGVKLNLMLAEKAAFQVVDMPCAPGEDMQAALALKGRMDALACVRGLELFSANTALNVTGFLERVTEGREGLPVFGAMANTISQALHGISREETVFAIGESMISSGFVAVIYSGETLQVSMDYILGWQTIGREMTVTLGEKKPFGESCVREIDGRPAIEIYRKYLGVEWDEYFVSNICEFPLMVRRNDTPICMIPLAKSDNGELYFSSALHEGEKLCFSYATEEEVLGATLAGSKRMVQFGPEAVFLSLCGNRVNYLQEDAHIEWDYYREHFPELVYCHGHYEISYQNRKGGVLNSSFIAVGFRERAAEGEAPSLPGKQLEERRKPHGSVPLPYRMSRFLHMITRELSEMAVEAEAANRAKSAFLSSMSHEIRTPINAVLGMNEMILRGTKEDDTYSCASDIETAGKSLLGLVNDILDFSKIEAGKLAIIPVEYSMASVLHDLANLIRKRAEDKGLGFVVEADDAIPRMLYGDEVRLKQIITNLLTNAVKYTETGMVTLQAGFVATDDEHIMLKIAVKDTGIGIKQEDISKLFAAFERIEEKRNRNVEGTGLGMSITSQLLAMMGSKLSVESVYGQGSVFSFELEQTVICHQPMGDFRALARTRTVKDRQAYRARFVAPEARLLVVDDTPLNLTVMKGLLKETQVMVDTAESGRECLSKIAASHYDMIFLDHRMPDMDGAETLAAIRKAPGKCEKDVPVIAMTANNVIGARDIYLSQGFAEYLLKPIDTDFLEELVQRFLPEGLVQTSVEDAAGVKTPPETAPGRDYLPEIAGLHAAEAREAMGSEGLYMEVLKDFAGRIEETAQAIEEYAAEGDIENYTIKVHALKSSARIVGAQELSELAAYLEQMGNEGNDEAIRAKTPELLAMYRRLSAPLHDFMASITPSERDEVPREPLDKEQLAEALAAMQEFLTVFDYESTEQVLSMLEQYSLPKGTAEILGKIAHHVSRFEQEKGMSLLKELLMDIQ